MFENKLDLKLNELSFHPFWNLLQAISIRYFFDTAKKNESKLF